MSDISVEIHCCLCPESHKVNITMPDGWDHRYGGIDDEDSGFCPKHASVAAFAESQCPGCVGGWGECDLWQSFAYSGRRRVSEEDIKTIERGVCPKRTNGTFGISAGSGPHQIEDIDLSETPPEGAGKAFADAIRDYIGRYADPTPTPTRLSVWALRGGDVRQPAQAAEESVMDDAVETGLQKLLARLKANDPNFETHVERGRILMTKKAHELTDNERAFLDGDRKKMT